MANPKHSDDVKTRIVQSLACFDTPSQVAKAIKAELDGGADFAKLAADKSIDPSAKQNGGDLGFFKAETMVKPFADAAFALKVNEISAPVQSQFGWHVIKLIETRKTQPPPFEQVASQLQQQMLYKKFDDTVASLKKQTQVSIPDPQLAAAVKAQEQQQAPAPGGQ